MTKRSKFFTRVAVAIGGLALIAIIAAVIVARTEWFRDFVRQKIVSSVEDSTGGKVELKAFNLDWHGLTAEATGFVIHGTEPPGSPPLFEARSIVVRMKLLTGVKKPLDLEYLGVDDPRANVIVFPNGDTNIPTPKVRKRNQKSGLETVVDLAIHKIDIRNGIVQFLEQKLAFNVHGQDLRIGLMFDFARNRYQGEISMDPLYLASGTRMPLNAKVTLPLVLERDKVQLTNARIETPESSVTVSGAVQNLASPEISGQLNVHLALNELTRSLDLPIHPKQTGGPQALDAQIGVRTGQNVMQIQNASISLGGTHFEASGDLKNGADLRGYVSLDELGELMRLAAQPGGHVQIVGKASLTDRSGYLVTGNVYAPDISFKQGNSRVTGVQMTSSFLVDPKTIAANDLRLRAFGGELAANARVENLAAFTLQARLRDFQIHNLSAAMVSKPAAYAGSISGTLDARGDLKAPGTTGIGAQVRLAIAPGGQGTPVSGQINVAYSGSQDTISIANSQIRLPNTRIDLAGEVGKQAEVRIVSRNLDDFVPALALASSTANQPVTLRGGTASLVTDIRGPLRAPQISGHLSATSFTVEQRPFDRLAADFNASPSGANLANGALTRNSSQMRFSASVGMRNWSAGPNQPLTANATMRNGDLADLLALSGKSDIPARGTLNADIRIAGTVANPQGNAQISVVNGAAYDEPFDRLQVLVDLSDQLVDLKSVQLAAGDARLDMRGSFTHPRDSFQTGRVQVQLASNQIQLNQFKTLQKERPGLAGIARLSAELSGNLQKAGANTEFALSAVTADLSVTGVRDQGQNYGNLTATAHTYGSDVNARVDSDFAGSSIQLTSRTRLQRGYPTTADAAIRGFAIEKALSIAAPEKQGLASGMLSATVHAKGTVDDPQANLSFELAKAKVYDEPVDRLAGAIDFTNRLVNVSSLEVVSPAGRIGLTGSLSHAPSDFTNGKAGLHLTAQRIDLQRVQTIQKSKPGLSGTLRLTADVAADLRKQGGEQQVLLSRLDANGDVAGIEWNKQNFGNLTFQGETKGNVLSVKMDSDFAKSAIHGTGQVHLQGDYPMQAKLTFANVTYSGVQGFLGPSPEVRPNFDGLVEGQVSVNGPARQSKNLQAELQLSRIELFTTEPAGAGNNKKTMTLQNQGPVVVRLDRSIVRVESARMAGPSTNITIGGTVALDQKNAFDLKMNADVNLAVLRDFLRDVDSSGNLIVNSTLRGSFEQPLVNGQIDLKNASINYTDLPNGISNANGVIALNGKTAVIRSLTAESGGGKIAVDGTVSFTGATATYNVQAKADNVRMRYEGASVVTKTSLTLTGSTKRSVLAGDVTIERVAYNQQSDIGTMLSGSATPPKAPSASVGPLAGMRLNIRIRTAPDVRFQTSLAQELQATADLNLRGTLESPGMTGRINITRGTLIFFGNKYTVNRGTISFFNATAIQPVLDIDLETSVKSVDVVLGVTGPIDNLKLSYRSDPPLKFDEIIALLATGKTPPDPTIAAHQPAAPEQSLGQMGESAILSQAVANPIANRLERVFGVTQLKIDPTFTSGSALPQARVTLQQQVTGTITFTYTQDMTQPNSQIIRVEWEMTPRFSAIATRDENGIFGIDFFYKKQFR